MTTISTIVKDALRESNLIAISATPTALEEAEALRLLNRYVSALIGNELGELFENISYGNNNVVRPDYYNYMNDLLASYYVPENFRLILNLTEPKTIYLNPNPQDGARFGISDASANLATNNLIVTGNGRTIEEALSQTLSTNGVDREWIYRADQSNWFRYTELEIDDESPLPPEFDDLLVIGLAMRLNPRNGVAIDDQSVNTYKSQMKKLKSRYRQSRQMPSEESLARINDNYRWPNSYSTPDGFNRGWPIW